MFILSSKSFLEAYRRIQYMKQYASFRKIQGDEIKVKMAELENTIQTLEGQKKEKVKLVSESQKEKKTLEADKQEQQKLVKTIQKDKKKYTAEIKKKEKESKQIQQKIDAAVREAIAAANKKTAKSNTESKTTTTAAASSSSANKIVLTKEGKIISDNFKANKGKLSYPVAHGYISQGYGDQPHPVVKTERVHNSGVNITTNPGESVRSVFAGEVSQIQLIADSRKKIVIIQHGDFFTIYYNLETVSVSSGQKVTAMQNIGTAASNPVTGEAIIKFCILQNTTYLNPSSWIVQ
jgi:septal ring factor EnvC (AmiA/AmiB activator)